MIVYGKQIILYLLQKHPQIIQEIFLAKEIDSKLFAQIVKLGVKITRLDFKKAQAMARGGNHQGMLAQILPIQAQSLSSLLSYSSLVVLCGISDVGNIGSIVRSAYALGVEGVVFCNPLSSKALESVVRLSSGALLSLPFCFCPHPLDLIHQMQQAHFACYGADMKGDCVFDVNLAKKWALFMGSEGDGLHRKIIQKMDRILGIEMCNDFNSLNVGVACGILLYGLVKSR